jgi:predicted  nucleic acid-binding Zn-ribbon protein
MQASIAEQKLLIDLQTIDLHITVCNNKIDNAPERQQLKAIEERALATKAALDLKIADQEEVKVDLRRIEIDVEAVSTRIAQDESRLANSGTSAKELEGLTHEVASLNKRKRELEDGEIEVMERLEAMSGDIALNQSDLDALETLRHELQGRLDNLVEQLNSEIAIQQSEREKVAVQIQKPLLDLYEKIRGTSAGIGAVRLTGDTCGGCHLSMTSIELQKIKALPEDEIVRCEECRRILVRI